MKKLTKDSYLLLAYALIASIAFTGCQAPDHQQTLKPVVDQVVAAWNSGELDDLGNLIQANVTRNAPKTSNTSVASLDSLKSVIASFHGAFPDLKLVLDEENYLENKAVIRWTFTGTNTGAGAFPATGKPAKFSGTSIITFSDGKIAREEVFFDNLEFMGQLGYQLVAPAPPIKNDPTVVDPAHYKVAFENERVKVLRINYKPGEKSVMHDHRDGVAVYMNDAKAQFTLPDGTVIDAPGKKGEAVWAPAGPHLPANVGKNAFEVILVELKSP